MLFVGSDLGPPFLTFNREEEKEEPMSAQQPQSNRMRIGILIASLIFGVIWALFSLLLSKD